MNLSVLLVLVATTGRVQPGVLCSVVTLGDGVTRVFELQHSLVIEGSESVYLGGRLLDSTEYLVDYRRGQVVLASAPPLWSLLVITYRSLQLLMGSSEKVYQSRPMVAVGTAAKPDSNIVTGSQVTAVSEESAASGLVVSGSKSLGVSFGSAGGIEQSTRLTVTGRVEGVDVAAELSDAAVGIPAEGMSQRLDEFDRLLLQLRGRHWRATMGDIDIVLPAGNFGSIRRRVIGARAGVELLRTEMTAHYAAPKGRSGYLAISGEDGVQGPYVLTVDGREATIVAGSEQVWLDGEKLNRGWDADYTIDYLTGEVFFTNRRQITRSSRIEISYQTATTDYVRSSVAGTATVTSGPFQLGVLLFREEDDTRRPTFGDLTESERRRLASVTADSGFAWFDGAVYVGPGKGEYQRDGSSYRYVGPGAGDYRVTFTAVADSAGDYVYDDSLLAWRYVGPGQGNYVARKRIALPERHDLGVATAALSQGLWSTTIDIGITAARSNLFSTAAAAAVARALNVDAVWGDSTRSISYSRRMAGRRFKFPGEAPEIDFPWRWGGIGAAARQASDEVKLLVKPAPGIRISAEAGRLQCRNLSSVPRYSGDLELGVVRLSGTSVGATNRAEASIAPRFGAFLPSLGWRIVTSGTGREDHLLTGISTKQAGFSTAFDVDHTIERFKANASLRSAATLARGRIEWQPSDAYRTTLAATYNSRSAVTGSRADGSRVGISLSIFATPRPGIRLTFDGEQAGRRVQLGDETFRYVGTGRGTFRRDSATGRYLPDSLGDYERVLVPSGRTTLARELAANGSIELSQVWPVTVQGSFSHLATTTDTGVLRRLLSTDLRMALAESNWSLTPALGTAYDIAEDQLVVATGTRSQRARAWVELYGEELGPFSSRARIEGAHERVGGTVAERNDNIGRVEISPVLRLLRLELPVGLEWRRVELPRRHPELGSFDIWAVRAGLARSFLIQERGRVRCSVELLRRLATIPALPYEVAVSEPTGWLPSATIDATYAISKVLSASARYSYRDRPDRPPEHGAGAELRADF